MKYAVHYSKDFKYMDEVDEIIFNCVRGNDSIVTAVPNIAKRQEQRVIFDVTQIEDLNTIIPYFNQLKEIHSNFVVGISFFNHRNENIDLLKQSNLSYMFAEFPKTIESLYAMAQYSPTDIYIVESLGFKLKDLQVIRNDFDINFRVFPDVAQCALGCKEVIPTIKRFWIRPEDTEIYEQYVDVFEIFTREKSSTLFEIYKKRQWLGHIEDIITSCGNDIHLDNKNIDPHFALWRINCGQHCYLGGCDLCNRVESLAEYFKKANITIVKDKYKLEK